MPKDNSSILHSNWWSWPVPPKILPLAVQLLLVFLTVTLPVLDLNVRHTKFHFWVLLFHLLFQYWRCLIWLQVVLPFLSRSSLLADSITSSCFCGFGRTPISISIATVEWPLLSFLRLRWHSNAVLPFSIRSNSLSAHSHYIAECFFTLSTQPLRSLNPLIHWQSFPIFDWATLSRPQVQRSVPFWEKPRFELHFFSGSNHCVPFQLIL